MPRISHPEGLTLATLAQQLAAELRGNPEKKLTGLCPLDKPVKGSLSFLKSTVIEDAALEQLKESGLGALLVSKEAAGKISGLDLLIVKDPLTAFTLSISLFFAPDSQPPGIHPTAQISPSARLGRNVSVGPQCVVGDDVELADDVTLHASVTVYPRARIGEKTQIYSNVVVREDSQIGRECLVHNCTVIGADGFGYHPGSQGELVKIPQIGKVVIEDRVEIGANSCIDRATLGETRIGTGTKIDNLVQVGHNTIIGKNCIICGCVGIAGSCTIGDRVVLGGGSGVADHLTICNDCRFGGRAVVLTNIDEPGDYAGYPAFPAAEWRRTLVAIRKLPEFLRNWNRTKKSEV